MPITPFLPAIAGAVGAGATIYSANKAAGTAEAEGARVDQLEREKFAESKRQAELLRAQGDEAAAVAVEEAARADLGAQKYENLSNLAAKEVRDFAKRNEKVGYELYQRARDAGKARQAAGEAGAGRIYDASGRLMDEARATEQRFSPFMASEADSLRQLRVEMGLDPGDVNRSYREANPAYQEYMDASRVAEQDAARRIDQAAGNTGTLYSGTRGAALMDRYKRGDFERAGIEQSYYQMYMDKLGQMANPQSTQFVSQAGMNAAGTGINAAQAAESLRTGTMLTGREGLEVLPLMRTGGEGADIALQGMDTGTAGSPYRLAGEDYKFRAAGGAGQTILPNMPTGAGGGYRLAGAEARGQGVADAVGGATNLYTAYMMNQGANYGAPPAGSYSPAYNPTTGFWRAPSMMTGV